MKLQGKVWKYGDNIDTDVIIPARYLVTTDPQALAAHCMEDIDAAFAGEVQPGDIIEIDLDARSLNVRLSDDELQRRLAALPPFKSQATSKWLRRYAHFVTSADTGAVLTD